MAEQDAELRDFDNGNVAVLTLLEDDFSHLSSDNQEISRTVRDCTPEQLRRIPLDLEDNEDDVNDEEGGKEGGIELDPAVREEDEDDEDVEDEESRGNQDIFEEAKSMVVLSDYSPKKRKKDLTKSPLWEFMKVVSFREGVTGLKKLDGDAHAKLTKAKSIEEYYMCCLLCYDDPEKSLSSCMYKGSFKKKIMDGNGNLIKHMKKSHGEIWNQAKDPRYVYQATTTPTSAARMSAARSDSISELYPAALETSSQKPPVSMVYRAAKYKGDQDVLNKFHNLIVQYGTNNDIPERTMTDHTACPEFKKMIMYAIEHGSQLSGQQNLIPGRQLYQSLRKDMFDTLVAAISWRLRVTRQHWAKFIGHDIPFIILCHDVWESKKKEVLGVTIMFFDPDSELYERIPIGLELCTTKISEQTSDQILEMLKTFDGHV
jgi:hypothetical protein